MCYNTCSYANFNPLEGEGSCSLPSDKTCPMDEEETTEEEEEVCDVCQGYNYELLGCCGGHECGCMGQPVDAKPCPKCNADGKKEPSLEAKTDWPYFFLTREEWDKHLAEKKSTEEEEECEK